MSMDAAPPPMLASRQLIPCRIKHSSNLITHKPTAINVPNLYRKNPSTSSRITAVNDEISQAEVTWEIVVGALAGVTPFVVAGIEFSKRIVAQKKCDVCKGSGLVLRDKKYYFRCPRCGGFLPWQSWRRFFTG